ncbi:IucA/IucC family protein [Halopiger goleimassiliensis]|uniref:IucA/IucC family protein n=1 Tax=Halopiger goleimassiliensis TaxID=1293048 RepID=UPI000677EF1E|nr:IucA/IucC family protein [Halopiger goleimassiliensis]
MTRPTGSDPVRLRTDAERDALGAATQYARVHDRSSPADAAYLEALPDAREEIARRLVRGLLRGRPEGLPDYRIVPTDRPSIPDDPEPLGALETADLESVLESAPDSCDRAAFQPFSATETVLIAPVAARHGYDRFRFAGRIRLVSPTSESDPGRTLEHPVDLVDRLAREGTFVTADQAERIRSEVAESVANLALARLARSVLQERIANARGTVEDSEASERSSLEAVAAGVPAADPATAFERIVTDGHPFHPAGKLRRGMSAAEGLAYAPEFADRIDVRFVAVDRDYALETSAASTGARLTDGLLETVDGLAGALEHAIPADRDPDGYAVVPVHPLQYHRTIPRRYASQHEDGRVVPIPDCSQPATPQLNLRTVVPVESVGAETEGVGPARHLKLAIPVQTTNVVRTLSPHAVWNGPKVTDVLREIAKRESLEHLGVLAEPAATCYYPPNGPHPSGEGFDDARHLSALRRTNPSAHPLVPDDGIPIVASSLLAEVPAPAGGGDGDGRRTRPLVCALLERYESAADARIGEGTDAALTFLERYAAVVVPEQLRLLSGYGVALESHLQNGLVVFEPDTAAPIATLVRDLGGIRVHRGRLADRGLSIDPYPDSDVDADGEGDLHRKLYYALFQNHLAELVAAIGHERGVDERLCWERIRSVCERAFDEFRADGVAPGDRIARDERALYETPATHKALTAMRLRGKRHEYVTSAVSNPLSLSRGQ